MTNFKDPRNTTRNSDRVPAGHDRPVRLAWRGRRRDGLARDGGRTP